ncbi:uncharacterized protein BYT42DRAFT_542563 [Radiomyces spectabilis]|uniref:uncharacterized protein n=1 Tax=Radiomyces spectabilis TaxID=64574 RepID=UPI0022211E88|nr:uncharacterized protein BYT42DRAFT_542563 [Radiomyces spectabilis]KAI8390919.1 hypothetical protein BYT42DRAFT_542563 [Radiomyces spectabilis]
MSQIPRQEIHALYRSYLRLVRDWPADKVRPNRDMKQMLAKRVEETFRQPLQSETEVFNIDKAKKQLDALERLLDNEFKLKYPLSDKILSPASNPKYYSSLISSLSKDGKSSLARLFNK